MEDMMEIVKLLKESGLLAKGISETKMKKKEQNGGFLPKLLGTLAAGLLGSVLPGKGLIRTGEGIIRVSKNF